MVHQSLWRTSTSVSYTHLNNIHNNNSFTYENEEITNHACCIALPIREDGKIVAALSVSFLTFTTSSEKVLKIKKELLKSASIIERIIKNKGFSY